METIDIKMTWTGAARIYCAALEDGTHSGKIAARDELLRLARLYDGLCDRVQELRDESDVTAEFDDTVFVRVPRHVWEGL